jgi:hypothetical protein
VGCWWCFEGSWGHGLPPLGGLGVAAEQPGRLPGGTVGDVLPGRHQDRRVEQGRATAWPHRRSAGPGPRPRPGGGGRPDRRPGRTACPRPRLGPGWPGWWWPAADQTGERWRGGVGGALALEVGNQDDAVRPGRSRPRGGPRPRGRRPCCPRCRGRAGFPSGCGRPARWARAPGAAAAGARRPAPAGRAGRRACHPTVHRPKENLSSRVGVRSMSIVLVSGPIGIRWCATRRASTVQRPLEY